jgi:hypothetical protein
MIELFVLGLFIFSIYILSVIGGSLVVLALLWISIAVEFTVFFIMILDRINNKMLRSN